MVELKPAREGIMFQAFAGDAFNAAVYLKRSFPDIEVNFVSAVGKDKLSKELLSLCELEGINTKFVFQHAEKSLGIYLIETDKAGERSFTYWRNDSAAKQVINFFTDEVTESICDGDVFFFSGISLAIIDENCLTLFWDKLFELKKAGVKIVFDPNYRPALWKNIEQTKFQFDRAFKLADIVMPGVDDLECLYGVQNAEGVTEFFEQYSCEELIVKNGAKSVVTEYANHTIVHPVTPTEIVVDSTSAGDAFDGVYLGARLQGKTITESVKMASKAAGIVIQYSGAIAPRKSFLSSMNKI